LFCPQQMQQFKIGSHTCFLHVFRDNKYILKQMTTFGTTSIHPDANPVRRRGLFPSDPTHTFRHDTVCFAYYQNRNAVDINNNVRQKSVPIEDSWTTSDWPTRCFAYLVATAEANAMLVYNALYQEHRGYPPMSLRTFRMAATRELMKYPDHQEAVAATPTGGQKRKSQTRHEAVSMPQYRAYNKETSAWDKVSKTRFAQRHCHICNRRCRTYCSVCVWAVLCSDGECYVSHVKMFGGTDIGSTERN
jgi:hypothetical protein